MPVQAIGFEPITMILETIILPLNYALMFNPGTASATPTLLRLSTHH